MFGRQSSTATVLDGTVADERTGDVVETDTVPAVDEPTVERREAKAARNAAADQADADRTERIMAKPKRAGWRTAVEADPAVTKPVVVEPKGWTHVSTLASLSLIAGTLAVAATLTGLLAPLGFATGVVAALLGIFAFPTLRRPNVTGHGLMVLGVFFGAVAIVLSLLAINGELSWLNSKTDEIANVHTWLNDNMHWLRRW
jgi:hypothetical protein